MSKVKKVDFWEKIISPAILKSKLAIVANDSLAYIERTDAASFVRGMAGYYRQSDRKSLCKFILGELKKAQIRANKSKTKGP